MKQSPEAKPFINYCAAMQRKIQMKCNPKDKQK
jgi:hypothetical protein